ncbi:MAG: helix-turn-helix transcriptional regulator [Clostridia bacterium]|nr:helix-turn-helix transcriptional regulator [Clostridia bacterium]
MGNRISCRRKELKLTQEQVAEAINLSLQSVSCIELGKKAIRPENLYNLCKALDISADYILTGTKSNEQLSGIIKKISELDSDDYEAIESLVNHFHKKSK